MADRLNETFADVMAMLDRVCERDGDVGRIIAIRTKEGATIVGHKGDTRGLRYAINKAVKGDE